MTTDKQEYWSPKFGHNPLTEALWMITLDSGQDEEAGTVDDIGWHALIHIETTEWNVPVDETTVDIERGTYIVWTDDQGFVGHETFEYRSAEASEEWRKILAAESDAYDAAEAEEALYEQQLAAERAMYDLLPE